MALFVIPLDQRKRLPAEDSASLMEAIPLWILGRQLLEHASPRQKVILRNWAPPLYIRVTKNGVAVQQELVLFDGLDKGKFHVPSKREAH